MGLFDYFYVDYPLPIPSYIPDSFLPAVKLFLKTDQFQSKDMSCIQGLYQITNDGRLFHVQHPSFESNEETKKRQILHHGYIRIYGSVVLSEHEDMPINGELISWLKTQQDKDIWLEYRLKYTDGILVNAEVIHPTKEELDEFRLHTGL